MVTWLLLSQLAIAALPSALADSVSVADCATVISTLISPATDEERLAVGWCQVRLDEPASAVSTLAPVTDGVLGEYGRWIRAQALSDSGDPAAAVTALDGLTLPGDAGLAVRLERGRALVLAERSLDAREGLRELLDTSLGVEARFWLSAGAEQRGDTAAAIATYQRVWATAAHGDWAERAAERLAALGAPVPDFDTKAGRALVHDRVDTLTRANDHEAARALLELLAEDVAPSTASGIALARTRFKSRDYAAAVTAYRDALGTPDLATGSASDLFDYALATARAGDYDTAGILYRRVFAQHPTTDKADFASYKLGYMEYDRGECTTARSLMKEHIARYPASAHLDEALWFAARCAWKQGDLADAVAGWNDLIRERPTSSLVPGALYWQARALGRSGDTEGEQRDLAALIGRYPVSGYAWFAAQRTGRTWPKQEIVPRPEWPSSLASRDDVQRAETLLGVGFERWALDELRSVQAPAVALGKDGALAAAHAFIAAGDYRTGKDLAKPYCDKPWVTGDPVAQQACHPMPEASVVATVAGRYGLDPLLPYGIMVAESALEPDVTSIAGARGLMQIMPAEAPRMHAALFSSPYEDPDLLYVAAYNASLGTTELGMKSKSLDETLVLTSVPAVIASYNGGEQAVRRWLATSETPPDFDEFAEDVGYTETRRYVKRVLGFVMAYRWVYGDR